MDTQLKSPAKLERRCQGMMQEVKLSERKKRSPEGHGGRQDPKHIMIKSLRR